MAKRYIKNIFPIAGVEWRDGTRTPETGHGIVIAARNITTDTDRRIIADEQYIVNMDNFVKNVIFPLLPDPEVYYRTDLTGELTDEPVGNILAGTPVEDLKDRLIDDLLDDIFFTDPPFIFIDQGNAMQKNTPVDDIIEVGTPLGFDVDAAHLKGFIGSPNGAPLVEFAGDATKFTFTDWDLTVTEYPAPPGNIQNHIGVVPPATLGDLEITCDIEWELGVGAYFDENGMENHAFEPQRGPGAAQVVTSVAARYLGWFGSGALLSAPIDSATVRALPDPVFLGIDSEGGFSFTVPAGTVEAYFYLPTSANDVQLFHDLQTNTYLTSGLVKSTFNVNDANGDPVSYDSYVLTIGGIGYLEDALFKVTSIAP